jgi:transposase-like protein
MAPKNRYVHRSKISESKFRQVVRLFSLDLTALQTAEMTGLNRNTVNRFYTAIRERIAQFNEKTSPVRGDIEVDESYFGPRRVRGLRGRGAGRKTIVFGLFKRNGRVYTEIVPDCSAKTLQAIIRGHADIQSVIHSDGWRGYNGLVDFGYEKHLRVEHSENEFSAGDGNHINGIESFWGFAKNRLVKFHGIPKNQFYFHLKECEFRFNHRHDNIYLLILKILRENPLC